MYLGASGKKAACALLIYPITAAYFPNEDDIPYSSLALAVGVVLLSVVAAKRALVPLARVSLFASGVLTRPGVFVRTDEDLVAAGR